MSQIDELRSAFAETRDEYDDAHQEHQDCEEAERTAWLRLQEKRASMVSAENALEAALVAKEQEGQA
jgi:phenylalanine-4-hydroxylase